MNSRPDRHSQPQKGAGEASAPRWLRVRGVTVALLYVLVFAAWLAGSKWVVPPLIRRAYHDRTFGLLDGLITGQASHSLQAYLAEWSALADLVTGVLVAAGVLVLFFAALSEALSAGSDGDASCQGTNGNAASVRAGPGWILLLALWWGLLGGFVEAGYVMYKYVRGAWIPPQYAPSVDYAWMIPLAHVAALLVLGLAFWIVSRAWSRIDRTAYATAFLAFVVLFGLFRGMAERLELYAAALLALGLAVHVGRMTRGRERRFRSIVRRSAPVLLAVWIALVVAVTGGLRLTEEERLANLPAQDPGGPNVLLIILDTVRASSLSLYGYERSTTPELEDIAGSGVVFNRAMAPSSWTLPSHASVFTGRNPHELSVGWKTPLDDRHPTLAEYLSSRGYVSRAFVANYYYGGSQWGLGRGFVRYDDQPRSWRMVLHSAWLTRSAVEKARRMLGYHGDFERKTADDVNEAFLGWLDRRPPRPFFVFLNYFDAHGPYLPPEPWRVRFADREARYWLESDDASDLSAEGISQLRDAYDGSIAYLDDRLGRLFAELEARRLLENTIVVVTSDHGEEFGEHGLMFHGHTLYARSVRVPLVILPAERGVEGLRIDEAVSLADLPRTIVELAGVGDGAPFPGAPLVPSSPPTPGEATADGSLLRVAGRDVVSTVTRNPRTPSHYPVHKGDMHALVQGRWRYILNGDGREELYDLETDPGEQADLSSSERGKRVLRELRSRLRELVGESPSGR